MQRLNLFVYSLIYVNGIRSYADRSYIAERFLTIKQNRDEHFPKVLNIYMPTLVKRILPSALNFQLSKLNYIYQVSFFHINAETKLVEAFVTLPKVFPRTV